MFHIQMHVHVNACLTSLTLLHHNTYTSMHGNIICMFMAFHRKKRNPNLIYEGQTTSKHGRQRLVGMKTGQNRSILYKQK